VFSKLKENKPYYILDFENGVLKNELFINSGELKSFREEQFLIFKQTSEYIELMEKQFPIIQKFRKISEYEFNEDLKKKIPFRTRNILK